MDKGFNDDELADIMNEIESLEKEFSEEITAEVTAPSVEDETVEEVSESAMETEEVMAVEAVHEEVVSEEAVQEELAHEEPVHIEAVQEVEAIQEIDTEMNEIVEELSTMPVEELEAVQTSAHDDSNVHQLREVESVQQGPAAVSAPTEGKFPESSLNFSVQGDMKLNLFFNIGGKSVQLNIKENGFEIELDGGMKFTIPLDNADANEKKAA